MPPVDPSKRGAPKETLKRFLLDNDLARWHANVSRGSLITADVYARRLRGFCEQMQIPPKALARLPEKKLRDVLLDFITEEERKSRTGSYIDSTRKSVKSWLLHNGVRLTLPIRIKGVKDTPTLEEERVPSQPELRTILSGSGSLRNRTMAVLMAHSGLRPEVLGNYLGTDGLRLRDFPDLKIKGDSVEFTRTPAMVTVRPELSKAGHRYFTFLSEEGCEYVRQYLEFRARMGEKLAPDTDLIRGLGTGNVGMKPFIRTISVGDGVRDAIRSAGFRWRPYVLRAYFDTQLLLAESKGKVAHDYRVFWMGHKGSMEARYTTHKGRLPDTIITDMREAFRRCEPFLTTAPGAGKEEVEAEVSRAMLRLAGYSDDDIAEVDLTNAGEVRELVKDRLTASKPSTPPTEARRPSIVPDDYQEIVVEVAAVAPLVSRGWRFVAQIDPGKVVLASPANPGTSPTREASPPAPPERGASPLPPEQSAVGGPSPSAPLLASSQKGRVRPQPEVKSPHVNTGAPALEGGPVPPAHR